ncbi:MAG: hypothetical protein M3O30_14565 [Planctomycetota bacterium]|nr:hypothetical protein [Planctomycetota bacterium]
MKQSIGKQARLEESNKTRQSNLFFNVHLNRFIVDAIDTSAQTLMSFAVNTLVPREQVTAVFLVETEDRIVTR